MQKSLLNNFVKLFTFFALLLNTGMFAQTNVTVDASAPWTGGMNVYFLDGAYAFYSDWALADIKTELNTTENTISLYPNYNAYDAADPYWSDGENGNKIMEAISMIIDDNLIDDNITFSGTVVSNTLTEAYTVEAFIKVLNADWGALGESVQPLDETGNFTINLDATQYADAAHVQYGFIVTGINANPAAMETNGFMVVTAGDPQEPQEPEDITVTLDTSSPLVGYANWFFLDGAYASGSEWGLPDLKTTLDGTDNTIILQPNFSTYGDGTDEYWANGEIGNKIFEGNTYVQDDALAGQNVTFVGNTISNTLSDDYDAIAFIKVYDAGYALLASETIELMGGTEFTLNLNVSEYPAAAHVQYGFSVTGLNANPTQETALGSAVVTSASLAVPEFVKTNITVYPNPATEKLNFISEENIGNITIYNTLGQKVLDTHINSTQGSVDVSTLNSGMYIANTVKNGEAISVRFVKQ